jgi:hypothetical protein
MHTDYCEPEGKSTRTSLYTCVCASACVKKYNIKKKKINKLVHKSEPESVSSGHFGVGARFTTSLDVFACLFDQNDLTFRHERRK